MLVALRSGARLQRSFGEHPLATQASSLAQVAGTGKTTQCVRSPSVRWASMAACLLCHIVVSSQ